MAITVVALARCGRSDAFRCAGGGSLQSSNQAIKQSSNQAIKQESVFITEEQGRTTECTESKDFSASRKNLTKLRAKRNHLPTL
jgi:hypothetical protein